MRVPLSWLADYVDLPLSPAALAEELTLRGMEVAAIEVTGADWTDVVVGRVLDVARHPDADTLWLTRVDVGAGEPLAIVCGAQNLVVGQLVPVARVGAVLPGERRIERSKIRGVVSDGMLCSAAELGLGTDADGIHVLGTGDELPLGTALEAILGEMVLDVDVKPNRGDALSMIGLAARSGLHRRDRALARARGERGRRGDERPVTLPIEEPDLCPRFTARWFTGVRTVRRPRRCSAGSSGPGCDASAPSSTSRTTWCTSLGSRSTPTTPMRSPRADPRGARA